MINEYNVIIVQNGNIFVVLKTASLTSFFNPKHSLPWHKNIVVLEYCSFRKPKAAKHRIGFDY
jgi:hypothetical protein